MYTLQQADQHSFSRDVYVLDLLRTPGGNALVSLSSDQRLSVLDSAHLGRGPVASFDTSADGHGNVTALRVFGGDEDGSVVCTAGEAGNVAVWDLRAGKKVVQFDACQAPISSMACNPQTRTIAIGTELHQHQASLLLWDVRSTPSPQAAYHDLHSDDITTLSYHPSSPSILLSGSTDGLVNVYDTSIADEDEVTVQTLNLNASIHRAGFLGGQGAGAGTGAESLVYALSHDEKFALYDVSEAHASGDAVRDFGDLRGKVECQYVADVVPKVDGSGAIVGAGSQDQQMFELVFLSHTSGAWEMDRANSVGLPGAHGEEIVRAFCFFDQEQVVFTAGEDGNINAWRPGR